MKDWSLWLNVIQVKGKSPGIEQGRLKVPCQGPTSKHPPPPPPLTTTTSPSIPVPIDSE